MIIEKINNYLNESNEEKKFIETFTNLLTKKKFKKVKSVEKDEILFMSDGEEYGVSIEFDNEGDGTWVNWGAFDIKNNGKRDVFSSGNDPLHPRLARSLYKEIFG